MTLRPAVDDPVKTIYEFGPFRLDTAERLFLREGIPLHLQPKAFDILVLLVENNGHLVRKDDLIGSVWSDAFVEENNLTKNIHALRQALNGGGDQFIETVPRQGYRFKADVKTLAFDSRLHADQHTKVRLVIKEEVTEKTWPRPVVYITAAVLCVLLVVGGFAVSRIASSSPRPEMLGASNAEAFDHYKQARELWQTRSAADLHQATLLLERAVAIDPNFARGHAALADCYAFSYVDWKKAEDEANYALRLDPSLGEGHATIGFVRMFWEWKLVSAEAELRRAIELSPSYATGRQWYSLVLIARANGDAAIAEMRKAIELEPASVSINADLCEVLYFQHLFPEAETQCRAALAIDPTFLNAHNYLYDTLIAEEKGPEAVNEYLEIERIGGRHVTHTAQASDARLRAAFETGGIRGFWSLLAEEYERPKPSYYKLARVELLLGNEGEAKRRLYEAYEDHDFDFVFVNVDPVFDRLHTDTTIGDLKDRLMF